MIYISEKKKKFEESQFSKVKMEFDNRNTFKTISDQKNKEGCCFRKRMADLFIIGATRAFKNNVLRKELSKKDSYDAFNISPKETSDKTRTLVDKENFWRLFQLIAYANNIIDAGNDKESKRWEESHHILIDGMECTRIAEEFFKGGWMNPSHDSFFKLISSDFPDDKIIEELGIMNLEFKEDEELFDLE